MAWIEWCPKCKARILTTGQMEDNKPCEICQKEHAESLKDRMESEVRDARDS